MSMLQNIYSSKMKTKLFLLFLTLNLLAANEGTNTGNNLRAHYKNDFSSNVSKPLTSDAQFKTVNGTQSFNANLTCSNTTKSFLEVSYSGASDITVSVKIDSNLDGTKDKSFSFSNISGIGTNGVIKCNLNTWSNCKYYLWNLSNNNLSLQEVGRLNLGGGYCINSSCGSLAAVQKVNVLDSLGGAISSLYQTSNSKYLITKTNNDGNKIEFYGQNYEECKNYQDNKPTGSMDTTEVIAQQSNDENSVYYSLNKSVENQNSNDFDKEVDETIAVKNSVSVEGDTSDYTFTYSGTQQNEDGTWSVRNNDGKVNIDFLNPDIKYCEVKFLEEDTVVFTDGQTHHSSVGDTQTWNTKIVECTGTNYDVCPVDTIKGEIIKHPCGDIDNFAEVTSILMAVEEATDDFTCSF